MKDNSPLIKTISEKCRMCYTCVRDCPVKAIKVINGQAEVVAERCIGCGNCLLVCTQNAKQYYNSIDEVKELLQSESKVMAIIAPSFPAAFPGIDHQHVVSGIRELGFKFVCEVAFGADLVAYHYKKLISDNPDKCYIATTCPGIVSFIEKYHPNLVNNLAPIASPMIAASRALRLIYGEKIKIVFIGPCFAKKEEAFRYQNKFGGNQIDAVLSFRELEVMFEELPTELSSLEGTGFDPPKPGLGALFALSGGMLQAANMRMNLLDSKVLLADGKENFVKAIEEFENNTYNASLLEVLCCKGCIMGAGMSSPETPYFSRRTAVSDYVNDNYNSSDLFKSIQKYEHFLKQNLDISASFCFNDTRAPIPTAKEYQQILNKIGKYTKEDELNCGACGYTTCREHAQAIYSGLAENEMCLPYTIERLRKSLEDLNISESELGQTREALFNAEKLASMGQLSAGIAHEINNPLGVILLNATMLLEDLTSKPEMDEYKEDVELIIEQTERCKKIALGLLSFARKNQVILEACDVEKLVKSSLRVIMKPDNVKINITSRFSDPIAEIHGDKITQVMVNLIMNAIDAMPDGGVIDIKAFDLEKEIILKVKDNGTGIAKKNIHKIFEPLFTTKQMGKGTGLGLAISYGIVKMHRGSITVNSITDPDEGPTGTEFTIKIPRNSSKS